MEAKPIRPMVVSSVSLRTSLSTLLGLTGRNFPDIIKAMVRRLNRKITSLSKNFPADNGYVKASKQERMAIIWELTKELYSLQDGKDAERRLQRDVTNFIRQQN